MYQIMINYLLKRKYLPRFSLYRGVTFMIMTIKDVFLEQLESLVNIIYCDAISLRGRATAGLSRQIYANIGY